MEGIVVVVVVVDDDVVSSGPQCAMQRRWLQYGAHGCESLAATSRI